MTVPTLQTQRLTLRAPSKDDFSVYRDFYANGEASAAYGGPLPTHLAFRKLAADLGHWQLRGYGMWAVDEKTSGEMIGGAGLVWPEGWPRPELTWWVIPSARRKGYALEASRAVIAYAYDELNWAQVETHMNDNNDAARNLALKLGGRVVAREQFPDNHSRDVYHLPAQ